MLTSAFIYTVQCMNEDQRRQHQLHLQKQIDSLKEKFEHMRKIEEEHYHKKQTKLFIY